MPTPILVACLVVGVLLILVSAALHDRSTRSTRPRWTLLLLFLGIGVSAFGSAGLKKGNLGWWGYGLWVGAVAIALGVGELIRRSRTRRKGALGSPP